MQIRREVERLSSMGAVCQQRSELIPRERKRLRCLGVLLPGGGIKYATDHDQETMKRMPAGTPISMSPIGDRRNLKHHRKFWKLLELGFSYWVPDWTFVSAPEEWIAYEVAKAVGSAAGDPELYERWPNPSRKRF